MTVIVATTSSGDVITENDLLAQIVSAYRVEDYNPRVHVLYEDLERELHISRNQATALMKKQVASGSVVKVDIRRPDGKPGVAFKAAQSSPTPRP